MLHTAPLHGLNHQIAGPKAAPGRPGATIARLSKRCMQNPAEEQGAIWMVVTPAGTMGHTDYAGEIGHVPLRDFRATSVIGLRGPRYHGIIRR